MPELFTERLGAISGGWGYSMFKAAEDSPDRAEVYVTTLDTKEEIDAYSRLECLKISRKLYRNSGYYRRAVNGPPCMIAGTGLTPRPLSADKEWGKRAVDRFNVLTGSAELFDLGGKWNFNDAQKGVLRLNIKDGDIFPIRTRVGGSPGYAFFEGHQCGDFWENEPRPVTTEQQNLWHDGVRPDSANKALRYRFSDGETNTEVERAFVLPVIDYETRGQMRGVPATSHWLNQGVDYETIVNNLQLMIKNASLFGVYEKGASDSGGAPPGMGQRRVDRLSDGSEITVEKVINKYSGKMTRAEGELATVTNDRPTPNEFEFLREFLRQLAMGIGIPADVLFYLAGLRGAEVRLAVSGSNDWVKERQQFLVKAFCAPTWAYVIGSEIADGRLPLPSDGRWEPSAWLAPAKQTVDIGRDGNLEIKKHDHRLLTLETWAAENYGRYWEEFQDQTIAEAARGARVMKEKAEGEGVTVQEVYDYQKGASSSPAPQPFGEND